MTSVGKGTRSKRDTDGRKANNEEIIPKCIMK